MSLLPFYSMSYIYCQAEQCSVEKTLATTHLGADQFQKPINLYATIYGHLNKILYKDGHSQLILKTTMLTKYYLKGNFSNVESTDFARTNSA